MSRASTPDITLAEDQRDSSKQLIVHVREHPVLWDKNCDDYRDRIARDKAWKKIFQVMDTSQGSMTKSERIHYRRSLQRKWYNIRDSYVKNKKQSIRCQPGIKHPRQYRYAEVMKFLDSVYDYNNMVKGDDNPMSDDEENDDVVFDQSDAPYKYNLELNEPSAIKKLLSLIRKHPVIWNKDLPDYTNRSNRIAAWSKVYKGMDMNPEDNAILQKKWCKIRDHYVKSTRRLQHGRSGRPYVYSEDLSFLEPLYNFDHTFKRRKTSNDDSLVGSEVEYDALQDGENWIGQNFIDVNDEAQAKKKGDTDIVLSENVATMIVEMIAKENDEDRAFFTSLLPSVKKLGDDTKFEFRMKVMELLKGCVRKEKAQKVKIERMDEDWLDESFT